MLLHCAIFHPVFYLLYPRLSLYYKWAIFITALQAPEMKGGELAKRKERRAQAKAGLEAAKEAGYSMCVVWCDP
jgi:hypothetical protein